MWIKKNDLLVNLEKFDALYQDTLHPEKQIPYCELVKEVENFYKRHN